MEYLAIVGPTASGKTERGLELAAKQKAEIVSVDSRQVYRFLSIGTAKPLETHGIPYHLIDFLDPAARFSAAEFVPLALKKVEEIRRRGSVPIFVGGTGLYFKALTEGLAPLPPANAAIRERLQNEALKKGREALHNRLQKIDPSAAKNIPANNIQRLVRALEVYELTKKPITLWHQEHRARPASPASFKLKFIGLDPGREELLVRVETRCRKMLKEGMIEETEALLKKGYAETCPALTGLGYTRVLALLKGKSSREECLRLLIQDTRQYAKRQRTWFRHQLPVLWKK